MPVRTNGGVFNDQMLTGSLRHFVIEGANFSGAIDQYGQPVPFSAAEIIFTEISRFGYINIMFPNRLNISFALEGGRSSVTAAEMQQMIRALGNNVGVDHIDASNLTVTEVPYIFNTGGGGGASTFLQLLDTPSTYAGSANYLVTVNPGETGLVFVPRTPTAAFAHVAVAGQPTINAVPDDTLRFVAGTNITLTTNAANKSVTINAPVPPDGYFPVPPGTVLEGGKRYFVTAPGTVTLPPAAGLPQGSTIIVTKVAGQPNPTVFVNVSGSDTILTDLGSTDSLEMDATAAAIFVLNGTVWSLQIGSYNH